MTERFQQFASAAARAIGSPWAFAAAVGITLLWLAAGPIAHFSDTWQLVYNTITTLSTGLIVFLVQNSQNRSDTATHVKLDELIRAVGDAQNRLIGLEERPEREIEAVQAEVRQEAQQEAQDEAR